MLNYNYNNYNSNNNFHIVKKAYNYNNNKNIKTNTKSNATTFPLAGNNKCSLKYGVCNCSTHIHNETCMFYNFFFLFLLGFLFCFNLFFTMTTMVLALFNCIHSYSYAGKYCCVLQLQLQFYLHSLFDSPFFPP